MRPHPACTHAHASIASAAVSGMCAPSIPFTPCCIMQEVKASGLKPDTALLNALIRALGSGGLAKEAQGVFRTMVCCGPVLTSSAFTCPCKATLMSLWPKWGSVSSECHLTNSWQPRYCDSIPEHAERGRGPPAQVWGASRRRADQETYRLMTRICREAGLIKEALHAYRGMRRHATSSPRSHSESGC